MLETSLSKIIGCENTKKQVIKNLRLVNNNETVPMVCFLGPSCTGKFYLATVFANDIIKKPVLEIDLASVKKNEYKKLRVILL